MRYKIYVFEKKNLYPKEFYSDSFPKIEGQTLYIRAIDKNWNITLESMPIGRIDTIIVDLMKLKR